MHQHGGNVPILKNKWNYIPVPIHGDGVLFERMIPEAPITVPQGAGEQRYFALHHVGIDISGFKLVTEDVSCNGRFCDRQNPLVQSVSCGCFTSGLTSESVVAECTVELLVDLPAGVSRFGVDDARGITVQDFRSLRFSEFIFNNLGDYAKQDQDSILIHTPIARRQVNALVDYVNNNGGWTAVGWFKKGEVKDLAATTEEVKVDSDEVKFHLSFLLPTDPNLAFARTAAIRQRRVRK